MATGDVDADSRCGLCWEGYDYMTDPRTLPCNHVFCRPCLEGFYRNSKEEITCNQCNSSHKSLSITRLPKVTLNNPETDSVTLKCDRGRCADKSAICYCVTCHQKLCDTHEEAHETYFGDEHKVVNIETYAESPTKYRKACCTVHHKKELVKACKKCDKMVCLECDASEQDCGGEFLPHLFSTFPELTEEITAHFKELIKSLEERITETCKLSKQIWGKLDDVEEQCKKWKQELEKARDDQVRRIEEISKIITEKIDHYHKDIIRQIEVFDSDLTAKKDELEKLRSKLRKLSTDSHVVEKVKQKQEMTKEVTANLDIELGTCELLKNPELAFNEVPALPYASFINTPHSVMPSSEHDVGNPCYSVCHRENGDILLGCQDGVWILSNETMSLTKTELNCEDVTSIVEHCNSIYLLVEVAQSRKVMMCLPDFKRACRLFVFGYGSYTAATMSVSDDNIAVFSSMGLRQCQMIIYNFSTRQMRTTKLGKRYRPYFLPNGNLLTAGLGELSMRKIEKGEMTAPEWTCQELNNIYTVCAASDGLIYATTNNNQHSIYVINPHGKQICVTANHDLHHLSSSYSHDIYMDIVGKLLREIKHSQLPGSMGQPSLRGYEIAIPSWKDNKLHLFKLNYT